MTNCPYCGRALRDDERYCDFCEMDVTGEVDKDEPKANLDLKGKLSKLKKRLKRKR
ncbi:hypothetical protein KY358_06540 [Candidatus Woesearchaeota archaeon]|nr:hypothetical protein [Candidatus Woesearchaeota archaeon]